MRQRAFIGGPHNLYASEDALTIAYGAVLHDLEIAGIFRDFDRRTTHAKHFIARVVYERSLWIEMQPAITREADTVLRLDLQPALAPDRHIKGVSRFAEGACFPVCVAELVHHIGNGLPIMRLFQMTVEENGLRAKPDRVHNRDLIGQHIKLLPKR